MNVPEEFEYGEVLPGVVCPCCEGDLVSTSSGAYCDWCCAYVPMVGGVVTAPHADDDEDDDYFEDDE